MTKTLIATKVKDGWSVIVEEVHHCSDYTDVLKMIRYNGLEIKSSLCNDNKIYAE